MGNFPFSRHDLKISSEGFKIESPQIFNMRILIISKPWALFGLRFLMIFDEFLTIYDDFWLRFLMILLVHVLSCDWMVSFKLWYLIIWFVANNINFVFFPAGIYLLKGNNRNTRTRCEICSKLTIKTPKRYQTSFWCLYC